ncbi:MAG: hypothetical protein Q8R32_02815 [bacterium]|nr:hypothetical protein [bacterium]
MAEHLAVVSSRTLRRLLRTKLLTWTRRRREAPIGRVHAGDQVFFKHAGRWVIAAGTVAGVREARQGGRYVLALKFRQLRKLSVPFPIVKRDRRSWVVCASSDDPRQQRLLSVASPTVAELLQATGTRRARLSSRRAVRTLLAAYARQPETDAGLLVWLAFLAASGNEEDLGEVLRAYIRKPSSRVFPFAVFS